MNKLLLGDCLKKLREIEDNSVDFILTDPPYNLGLFMKKRATNLSALRQNHFSGKNWDLLEEKKWKKNSKFYL